jgi:GNAT superfamily N-acetyltransferase
MTDKTKINSMKNKFNYRVAMLADVPAMMEIRLAVKENVLSNPARVPYQLYVDYLALLGRGWVAERDGEIIAFSYAAKEDASIWALFVKPECEGLGAGKTLLTLAVEWLFSLGNATVTLSTSAHTRADRFYGLQGWRRGEMKDAVEVYYSLSRSTRPRTPANA